MSKGDYFMPLTLEEAVVVLRDANVNATLEFTQDKDGYLIFNLRGTPWRNSANAGMMILVAAHQIEDCVVILAEMVEKRMWVPLNFRVRLDEPGAYSPGRQWTVMRNARDELEKLVGTPEEHNARRKSKDPDNAP
jgi:hypothetical protein